MMSCFLSGTLVCFLNRRLSVEGTNPMAKEFTPSMDPLAPEVATDAKSGDVNASLPWGIRSCEEKIDHNLMTIVR